MELLNDPLNDRVVKGMSPPPHQPLSPELLFPRGHSFPPDWKALKNHLKDEGRVAKPECLVIVRQALQVFRNERNLIEIQDPVTIVGDVHGQFYDLLRLLEVGGDVANTKYLFLGDYVDRGSFSLEVVLLLYSIKINFPETVFLLRGNHESRQLTSFFNFRSEVLHKLDIESYDLIMESFDAMPMVCILNKKFLAVHGGISPELVSIQDLTNFNRFQEPPRSGLVCDLLWSDPVDSETGQSPDKFKLNQVRGCSYYYGVNATNEFLKRNKLISVFRAHEAQLDGYKMHRWNGSSEFPVVITIFSAPNYCDVYGNKGAIIKFENNTLNIQQFNYTQHPYILPNFMDIFTWSTPFVIEKTLEILYCLLKDSDRVEKDQIYEERIKQLKEEAKGTRTEILRNKVKAVSRMMRMFKTLREDKELILELKGLCPDNKIPRGLLQLGREAILGSISTFTKAKEADSVNERRPGT